ncbi:hypothetical protein [Uliginosibacterium flavum]|uniref:hypothetical protein n=1 Tax=Uliginosibacterium flavum TaxID=1396831 RepID=UPI00339BFC90
MRNVDLQVFAQQLLFNSGIVIFAQIDHQIQLHARKLALKSSFDRESLGYFITASVDRELAAFLERGLIQILQALTASITLNDRRCDWRQVCCKRACRDCQKECHHCGGQGIAHELSPSKLICYQALTWIDRLSTSQQVRTVSIITTSDINGHFRQ